MKHCSIPKIKFHRAVLAAAMCTQHFGLMHNNQIIKQKTTYHLFDKIPLHQLVRTVDISSVISRRLHYKLAAKSKINHPLKMLNFIPPIINGKKFSKKLVTHVLTWPARTAPCCTYA